MTTEVLKIKSDCVILDGKQLDIEKWDFPYQDAALRLQRPDLKILSLQKACSCMTAAAFAAAKGAAAHAAVVGVVTSVSDPRGVANEMKWKKGVQRGDLVAVLNPSLLPKADGSDSRAAAVEDDDQILKVQP
ncbi:hypothetical protein, conserved [Eimeria necatrix]|uniref:Uncharacterized protein n=1 Tax=Eimeria necatrix TaxID=51315 RepID=U6MUR0_9EIME|nr:hypothetical protein, conserved [Eimeria necatrix]CDJ67957.1 hypothetical protein, conserved [Eimeria necatrix]